LITRPKSNGNTKDQNFTKEFDDMKSKFHSKDEKFTSNTKFNTQTNKRGSKALKGSVSKFC